MCGSDRGRKRNLPASFRAELHRVALARLLASRASVWVLYKPLTSLNADRMRMVEDALSTHRANAGIAVITSHQSVACEAATVQRLALKDHRNQHGSALESPVGSIHMLIESLYRWASPKHFFVLSERIVPILAVATVALLAVGAYFGLVAAPPDYRQGDSYRIMFIHVPSAWMSLFVYVAMASFSAVGLVWRIKLADAMAVASAPVGASFTALTLITGSLWGKPMWGAWWVWDARLTSELILLFLYFGYIGLQSAIEDRQSAARASAVLALVGMVNIPIIHFSVQWWNTLHQGATVAKLGAPSIHPSMLAPLLLMALGFKFYYLLVLILRARCEVLERERGTSWVRDVLAEST